MTGPFVKRRQPILETNWDRYKTGENCTFVGPGHGSVINVNDDWWLLYHAWTFGHVDTEPGRFDTLLLLLLEFYHLISDKFYWIK